MQLVADTSQKKIDIPLQRFFGFLQSMPQEKSTVIFAKRWTEFRWSFRTTQSIPERQYFASIPGKSSRILRNSAEILLKLSWLFNKSKYLSEKVSRYAGKQPSITRARQSCRSSPGDSGPVCLGASRAHSQGSRSLELQVTRAALMTGGGGYDMVRKMLFWKKVFSARLKKENLGRSVNDFCKPLWL